MTAVYFGFEEEGHHNRLAFAFLTIAVFYLKKWCSLFCQLPETQTNQEPLVTAIKSGLCVTLQNIYICIYGICSTS